MAKMDIKLLTEQINFDVDNLIKMYMSDLRNSSTDFNKNQLTVLRVLQSVLIQQYLNYYDKKTAAMIYYGIGDDLVAEIVDSAIEKKKGKNKNG